MVCTPGYSSCLTKVSSSDEECLKFLNWKKRSSVWEILRKCECDTQSLGFPYNLRDVFCANWQLRTPCVMTLTEIENHLKPVKLIHLHFRTDTGIMTKFLSDPCADAWGCGDKCWVKINAAPPLLVSKCGVCSFYILWIKNGKVERIWRHTVVPSSSVRK